MRDSSDICARCAGGNNAGHTIVVPVGPEKVLKTFAFHLVPSGVYMMLYYKNPTWVSPGWNTSIIDMTSYDALPENCRKYIEFIEASLGVPVEWIGVGPGRNSMLTKEVI